MTVLAGRRIVLGVTGGIAAYKAIEVCRRLVDAGAHVVPVMTAGAEHFVGRTTFDALASEPVHTSLFDDADPIPHTRLGQTRRPRGRGAGHRPGARRLRRRHLVRPAHRHAARHPGAGRGLPGHAHRDVGAPGGAGQPGHAAPARRARGRARGRPPGRRRPGRRPPGPPEAIVAAVERVLGPQDLAGRARARHRRWHPGADRRRARHRQPLVGQAGLRPRRRGRRPRRRGHARHHRRPAGARRRRRRRGRDGGARWKRPWPPRRRRRRRGHGRRRGRLPPRRRRPTGKLKKDAGAADDRARADARHPRRARAGASGPARSWSASPPRPTTSWPTPPASSSRKNLDLMVANDVAAPGVRLRARHQRGPIIVGRRRRARCRPRRQAGRRPRRARRRRRAPRRTLDPTTPTEQEQP